MDLYIVGKSRKYLFGCNNFIYYYRNLITSCWENDPNGRPTFDQITSMLKNNQDFIIDGVDKDEYFDYFESIEISEKSFNFFKKF